MQCNERQNKWFLEFIPLILIPEYRQSNAPLIMLNIVLTLYRVFSYDVTAAILVSQNNETAAMLVSQTNPVGVELFSYVNAFFCPNKFA